MKVVHMDLEAPNLDFIFETVADSFNEAFRLLSSVLEFSPPQREQAIQSYYNN